MAGPLRLETLATWLAFAFAAVVDVVDGGCGAVTVMLSGGGAVVDDSMYALVTVLEIV